MYLLGRPSSPNLLHAIKDAFSRHGISKELVFDNGPQYAAREFKSFKSQWQFEHTTSSPHYPRSNGLAESTVKAVKRLIKKCHRSNQDILKGLLILRNTPIKCGQPPSQLLKGYTLRDNLPRFQGDSPTPSLFFASERAQSKAYHDKKHATTRGSREEFQPGQAVAIQHETTKEWSVHGTIIQQVAPRSYEIQLTIPYNQSDSDSTEQSSEEEDAENCRTRFHFIFHFIIFIQVKGSYIYMFFNLTCFKR